MKISIPAIPPSLNRYAGRRNDREYQADKRGWKDMVYLSCPKLAKPFEKAVVTITYYFPDRRRRDPDNHNGKFIMDGLTAAGVIKDDSFECVELRLVGSYDKTNPRTEITIDNR